MCPQPGSLFWGRCVTFVRDSSSSGHGLAENFRVDRYLGIRLSISVRAYVFCARRVRARRDSGRDEIGWTAEIIRGGGGKIFAYARLLL